MRGYGDPWVTPEVNDAVPLITTIRQLRREINTNCSGISIKARKLSMTNRKVELHLKKWEDQLNVIKANTLVTHNLEQLMELRRKCEEISDHLAAMSKK